MGAESKSSQNFRSLATRLFGLGSFGRYVFLGLSGIVVDVVAFGVLIFLGAFPLPASVTGSFLGIVTNYLANALFNFKVRVRGSQAVKFIVVGVTGLVVAAGIFQLAMMLGAGAWWAKMISLGLVVPVQFLANRFWSFR